MQSVFSNLSTVSFVSDLVSLILEVSNNSTYKSNIFFYQLCRCGVSVHYRLSRSSSLIALELSNSQQAVFVTSSMAIPRYSDSAKIYLLSVLFDMIVRVLLRLKYNILGIYYCNYLYQFI